jgi:farnesyl diphosphate synthase
MIPEFASLTLAQRWEAAKAAVEQTISSVLTRGLAEVTKDAGLPAASCDHIRRCLDYTVPGGKMFRAVFSVFTFGHLANPEAASAAPRPALTDAAELGIAIEVLQACLLVADDVMDNADLRRGKPCWYQLPGNGTAAINDAFLLESVVFSLLAKLEERFQGTMAAVNGPRPLTSLFHDVVRRTELGQLLDITALQGGLTLESKVDPGLVRSIALNKTSQYTFWLPVAAGALLAGEDLTTECTTRVHALLDDMGVFFQLQDDFLDMYAPPEVLGKIGRDVQEGKASWPLAEAWQRASETQRAVLARCIGQEAAATEDVRAVYDAVGIPALYEEVGARTASALATAIAGLPAVWQPVMQRGFDTIAKRSF